jgi:two-component system, OmpR family, sensor kinase
MKLSVRLWLLGAVVPFAGTTAALVVAGHVFRADLEHDVDEGLLSQAAVEAVSLFDGPGNKPHLHLATSPLGERVRHIAPAAAI